MLLYGKKQQFVYVPMLHIKEYEWKTGYRHHNLFICQVKSFVFDECVVINNLQWTEKNVDNEPYIMWNCQALYTEPFI